MRDLHIMNPYTVGTPISGSQMFFGREDVFTFVHESLIGQHRDNVLVIFGQQRTGKTSTLYQMHSRLDARYLSIYIDLNGLAMEGLGSTLWELANIIVRRLREQYHINLLVPNQTKFLDNPRYTFESEFLDSLWEAIGDRHVLLMLDEATKLQVQVQTDKLEQGVFEYLRYLMQHYERLNFLFSLSKGLEEMEKEYTHLFNVALYKKISFLSREAAIALITQPIQKYYSFTSDAQERILQLTSNHPYYTQLLCHCLFNHWQRQNQTKTGMEIQDVNTIINEALERGSAVFMQMSWEDLGAAERAVVSSMSVLLQQSYETVTVYRIRSIWREYKKVHFSKEEILDAIRNLIARDIIFYRRDISGLAAYGFTMDLQRLWVQRHRQPEWMAEEIAEARRQEVEAEIPTVVLSQSSAAIGLPRITISFPSSVVSWRSKLYKAIPFQITDWFGRFQPQLKSLPNVLTQHYSRRKLLTAGVGLAIAGLAVVSGTALLIRPQQSLRLAIGTTLHIYRGHTESVNAVAWSPDGKRIASVGDDKTVNVWDATSGKTIASFKDEDLSGVISAVAWASDNKRIAFCGNDRMIEVWNPTSRNILASCIGHTNAVLTVTWSPDNNYIVSGSQDATMRIWNSTSGKQLHIYETHRDSIYSVAWSFDGRYIASVGADGTIEVLDVTTNLTILAYQGDPRFLYSVAWSPDNRYLVTGGDDSIVNVWDALSSHHALACRGHAGSVYSVAWSPDGKYIASGSEDRTVKVWNADTGREIFTYKGHLDSIGDVSWSPDSKLIASAGSGKDMTVRVWNAIS